MLPQKWMEGVKVMQSALHGIYGILEKVSDIIQKILEAIVVLLVISCTADLLLQVVYRFVLVHFVSWSCPWTTEYAQDALIWITYFMVGICYKEGSMASVNFIYDRLEKRGKMVLYFLTRVIVIIFLVMGLKLGWEAIAAMWNWTSTSLHLPGYLLYSAPFVGCILMFYEVMTEIVGVCTGDIEPFAGRPPVEEEIGLTEEEKKELQSIESGLEGDEK